MLEWIDRFVAFFGKLAGYLTAILVLVVVTDVSLRFLFDLTAIWVVEVEWHLFSLGFLLGAPYALQCNRHVRVDLFYEKFSARDRGKVDFFGSLIFLLPWTILLFVTGWQYLAEAWHTGEGSPNPGGLPTFVPIKAAIPFCAFLLFLQGLAECVRAYRKWRFPATEKEMV